MFLSSVLDNVWLAVGIWVVLYCLDYLFTLKGARLYQMGANKHYNFSGGYELNPYFEEDIARLRRFSWRFWLMLVLLAGVLIILHALPEIFAFLWGTLVGVQVVVQLRHINNLVSFYYARDSRGVRGKVEIDHWLSLRLSAVSSLSLAILFLSLYLLFGSLALLGATVGCLSLAVRHFLDSVKSAKKNNQPRIEQ
jgi:hypothetical protein